MKTCLSLFFMGVYMFKRFLSFILCLSILLCFISIYVYTPVYVYASSVSVYDSYKTIYDGYDFSSIISQHKSFNFTDRGGKKHAVKYVGGRWMYTFGSGDFIDNDDTLNYFLSWYAYKGYNNNSKNIGIGLVSLINSKLGIVASAASDVLDSVMVSTNDIDFEYNEDNGLTILSDSVDKLREQLKKQYYNSIGLQVYKSRSLSDFVGSSTFRNMFEDISDYTDTFSRISDYKTALVFGDSTICRVIFLKDKISNGYLFNDSTPKRYYHSDRYYSYYPVIEHSNDVSSALQIDTTVCIDVQNYKYDSFTPLSDIIFLSDWQSLHSNPLSRFDVSSNFLHVYSDYDTYIFKSYEALYNYLHGSQSAFLSSKINGVGEDIQISIDDMNTNISDKMDELIDSINSGKGSMSADELQKAIDKGLASLSGKMDDIKDNTQETNNKLDSLLTVMQSQNEILMNILGVTTDIYTVVSSKDDEQDKAYDINYVQAVFNTMFKGLKNAVLYGENTVKQDVNQDTDDVNSLVTDVSPDKVNYRNGLFGKFPFSVPYQLYEWLQVLCAEPVAPSFTLSYDFLMKDFVDEDNRDNFKLIIDLNDDKYKEWADLMRSGEKLAFTIYMAIATYNRFKNEV